MIRHRLENEIHGISLFMYVEGEQRVRRRAGTTRDVGCSSLNAPRGAATIADYSRQVRSSRRRGRCARARLHASNPALADVTEGMTQSALVERAPAAAPRTKGVTSPACSRAFGTGRDVSQRWRDDSDRRYSTPIYIAFHSTLP
ncbi:hypothetical protein EVAR_67469_1 [Eumeta japonica]|uniref:Uncharacterized protein n=1 Tax=Eumeta variegata TaxID=151549 RepID=A0A4C1ZBB7_EUMVA|nr:hypothetical protein EVAR_67469_1 [Eumeta japonica]